MNRRMPEAAASVCLLCCMLLGSTAHAERADRQRPINVESDRMSADDLNQMAIFTGRVVVVQGTFVMCADQVTIRQDKAGNQNAIAVGAPALFREKRDGVDEWIEGEAERIEYDARNETLELFNRARVTREKDEVRGNFIAYNSRTEVVRVQEQRDTAAAPTTREGRVSAVFQPRAQSASGADARGQSGAQSAVPAARAPMTLQSENEPNRAATSAAVAPRPPGCQAARAR